MKVSRRFTTAGTHPFDTVAWTTRSSKIMNPDGSVVFEMDDAEVPKSWSQLATDIMVSKYFRKAGVPVDGGPNGIGSTALQSCDEDATGDTAPESCATSDATGDTAPESCATSDATGDTARESCATSDAPGDTARESCATSETSAKQVIHRLAGCWRDWGERHGYFDTSEDAQAFYDELCYMMMEQMAAPNSPQWFNTGLSWAYGISGPAQGHWYCDPASGEAKLADDAYSHPQPHACFIQSVSDDLVSPGGIMDLWTREARLFKYGSGTGTNFSALRAEDERLSGGGKSSGLMSWLRIGDRAAGAIKSGGTTRRAAKMVCLDMDHPDIESFINWKAREEVKVAAMVEGLKLLKDGNTEIADACERMGLELDYDFNGEAYATVSGQNSNNSVRIPDEFFDAIDGDETWKTYYRTSGEVAREFPARDLWEQIAYAAWRCADPGVQFDGTINAWHTCPSAGGINASNPCSEYMFVDNTACNLASLNVLKFYDDRSRAFDIDGFEHAVDLWTMVLEISVLMAAFPSKEIAELSYRYRTLGLGYANLGALLMRAGIPYDCDEARAVCATLSAILTGRSYRLSAQLAKMLGPFPGFYSDRKAMLGVIRNHRHAAHGVARGSDQYEKLRITPVPIDHALIESGAVNLANAQDLADRARSAWDDALGLGEQFGYRNAQVSVIAPTGTIGLLMDCDTTGVEPDFALVKFKKLAGGGYFRIANASVEPALVALGYSEDEVRDIKRYLLGALSLEVPMAGDVPHAEPGQTFADWLAKRGLSAEDLREIEEALAGVFELGFAFGAWSLGDGALERLGFDPKQAKADSSFNALRSLGLGSEQIDGLNRMICGTLTVEGAPHLRDEHLAVFDCASRCGATGERFIAGEGHIRMMAAAQPFISGAISKTINLPNDAPVDDIKACYRLSWELGLKANALYRDGCKLSQPLSASSKGVSGGSATEASADPSGSAQGGVAAVATPDGDPGALKELVASALSGARGKDVRCLLEPMLTGNRPNRRRLADTRRSLTHKFNIAGHEGYLTVGLYKDGKPGELFITMAKEGSTIGGLMDSLGTATSVSLQYGVPLESLVRKFTHQRFEPAGMTTNRDIPFAKSLVDYIFRWLGMQFIPGYREANAPDRPSEHRTEPEINVRTTDLEGMDERGDGPASTPVSRVHFDGTEAQTELAITGDIGLRTRVRSETLSLAMEGVGDAPPCDVCGTITVRSGTCYKCVNCGNSMGCS